MTSKQEKQEKRKDFNYDNTYKVYLSRTPEHDTSEAYLIKGKGPEIWFSKENTKRVLSVGSGTGWFDIKMFKYITSQKNKLEHYCCVEPDTDSFEGLMKTMKKSEIVKPLNMTFEKFLRAKKRQPYDLILFSHSIYYFGDDKPKQEYHKIVLDTLQNALNLLTPNGVLILIIYDGGLFKEIQRREWNPKWVEKGGRILRHITSTELTNLEGFKKWTGEKGSFECQQHMTKPTINIENYPDELSYFFVQPWVVKEELKDEDYDEIENYVKKNYIEKGKKEVVHPTNIVMIRRKEQ